MPDTGAIEEHGFIARRPDPDDRRSAILILLATGRRAMHAVELERRRRLGALLQDWDPRDRVELARSLAYLTESLTARALMQDE